jgi:protein arginine N-methyltransferase 1
MGFFALLACKYGARHVYALETNRSILQVARQVAAANGFEQRITFIGQKSTEVDLPEQADLIISDIRGALPWLADHIPSIVDARHRHLKPNGVLIPGHDTVWTAVIEAPQHYARFTAAWDENEYDLDLSPARRYNINQSAKGPVNSKNLLTEPHCWAALNYHTITDPHAKGDIHWRVKRAGTAHGLSLWFDTELLPGIAYSNAPDQPQIPIYSQMFFPWQQPVELTPGDNIHVQLQARLVDNTYEWLWGTTVINVDGIQKAAFKQSTFFGRTWSPNLLRQQK